MRKLTYILLLCLQLFGVSELLAQWPLVNPYAYSPPVQYVPVAPPLGNYQAYWVPKQGLLGNWRWELVYIYVPPQHTKTADEQTTPVPLATDWPYCCVADIQVGNAGGSATLVAIFEGGDTGLCISAAHVCEDGGKITLTFPDGYKCGGKILALDHRNDLAAIKIPVKEGMTTPRRVRGAKPSDGVLVAVGYPWYGQGREHWTEGKYLGYSNETVHFAARPFLHSGFSGGALFAFDGSYCGPTNGYGSDYSYATSGPTLEKFCRRWMKEGVGE